MMTALGADYSWARPGGAALAAAGVTAVGRYLATDGRGITAGEYADLRAHGIDVWLCREGKAAGMLSGRSQGVADAQIAVQQIAAAGLPGESPVYATADFDVSSAQFSACDSYLQGFASVIGVSRTGIYGGLHYLNHVHDAGLATHFWQAGATSWNHGEAPHMPINIEQTTNTPPLAGTDHDFVYNITGATITEEEDDDMPKYQITQAAGSASQYFYGPGVAFPIPNTTWLGVLSRYAAAANAGTPVVLTDGEWGIVTAAHKSA